MSLTIMLVENQPDLREVTSSLLKLAGHTVITEEGAAEALNQLTRSNVDLVITEIKLPVMDGNQFIKELSRQPKPPRVLVLTHDLSKVAPNPIIKEVLQKPFMTNQLYQFIIKAVTHL